MAGYLFEISADLLINNYLRSLVLWITWLHGTYYGKSWETMDNGYLKRTKSHQTSKMVGFLGMSVGCPDKIHLC